MSDEESQPVKVYIYDLSKGMARSLSKAFLGKQIDGVWHTGIVVFGQEYYFGGSLGIEACPPGGTILGQPDEICNLGNTQIPFDVFMNYLSDLSHTSFGPATYHLLHHNCNNFSSELAQFLTGKDIPSHITSLPSDVLSTPFGQMLKPWVDAMSIQPSGGHTIFPDQTSPESSSASDGGASYASSVPDFEGSSTDSTEDEQDKSPIVITELVNLCSTEKGHGMLTSRASSSGSDDSLLTLTSKLCVNCLLSEDKPSLTQHTAALAYNVSRYQIPEDNQVEIGSAILECLQKESNEQTVFNLMKCLVILMDSNTEVCDLASVVGMNCSQNSKMSARVSKLCEKAQQLTSL
ncbi:hypothetical protein KUTeg_004019 [Tegillarca granosa]|uniref:PPPDE domain-containing protein n=1 Tax=Tegillarca granosa TaxID=220873 RepID=A0ABQ9FT98_TEGGR|nr:hypothetical protein KUTeg_004019 [Tegillarca granosa]